MTSSPLSIAKKVLKASLLSCLLFVSPTLSHAIELSGTAANEVGDIGPLVGVTWANHDAGSHITWGATAHYNLLPYLNVGLYYQRFSNDTTVLGGTSYSKSYNFIAAEANYLLNDVAPGAYVGGKLGWAVTSTNLPNVNDQNNIVFGPAVGYDYALAENISFGGQFNVLWRTGDPFLSDVNLLALLKLHLYS